MTSLTDQLLQEWENREGPVVMATVSEQGVPNIIYATCVAAFGKDKLVVADNYFDKTRSNLKNGNTRGCILFRTKEGKAYQVKGSFTYHQNGEIFDHMKSWNPQQHPGHAAAALQIEAVYSGADKLA